MEPDISVLYVEDDARLAQLIATYLESQGLKVAVSPNGLDGGARAVRWGLKGSPSSSGRCGSNRSRC
jgi:DNA-binding response OmpR family regulator